LSLGLLIYILDAFLRIKKFYCDYIMLKLSNMGT